jgi:hypothetical protein
MPLKQGYGVGKPEISVVMGIGMGVAAVAGLAAGAALGGGMLAVGMATSRRNVKPALRHDDVKWDGEGRITNWPHVLKAVQQGVSLKREREPPPPPSFLSFFEFLNHSCLFFYPSHALPHHTNIIFQFRVWSPACGPCYGPFCWASTPQPQPPLSVLRSSPG